MLVRFTEQQFLAFLEYLASLSRHTVGATVITSDIYDCHFALERTAFII